MRFRLSRAASSGLRIGPLAASSSVRRAVSNSASSLAASSGDCSTVLSNSSRRFSSGLLGRSVASVASASFSTAGSVMRCGMNHHAPTTATNNDGATHQRSPSRTGNASRARPIKSGSPAYATASAIAARAKASLDNVSSAESANAVDSRSPEPIRASSSKATCSMVC